MANPAHLKILKQGVKAWNKWRHQDPGVVPDLRQADLSQAMLRRIDPRTSMRVGFDLSGALLDGADICGADLQNADCRRAHCRGARSHHQDTKATRAVSCGLLGCPLLRPDAGKHFVGCFSNQAPLALEPPAKEITVSGNGKIGRDNSSTGDR